jgi:hypothetical protein
MIELKNNLNEPPVYGAEVFGDFQIEVLRTFENEKGQFFELEIQGLTKSKFVFEINVEDAGGNIAAPDPGDVFRTLMKWLKEILCPHCL